MSTEYEIEVNVAAVLVLLWLTEENVLPSDAVVDEEAVESDESCRVLLCEELRRNEREGSR